MATRDIDGTWVVIAGGQAVKFVNGCPEFIHKTSKEAKRLITGVIPMKGDTYADGLKKYEWIKPFLEKISPFVSHAFFVYVAASGEVFAESVGDTKDQAYASMNAANTATLVDLFGQFTNTSVEGKTRSGKHTVEKPSIKGMRTPTGGFAPFSKYDGSTAMQAFEMAEIEQKGLSQ